MTDEMDKRIRGRDEHLSDVVLSELADGTLASEDAAMAEAHLLTCASCTETLEQLRGISLLLAGLPEPRLRRSFQLSPDAAFARGSVLDRMGAWLMPALPALRAATVAIALLLVASIAGDLLTEPRSTGPVMEDGAPQMARTELPVATTPPFTATESTTQTFAATEPTAGKVGDTTNEASLGTNTDLAAESESAASGAQAAEEIGADGDTSASGASEEAAPAEVQESARDGADDASRADALPADSAAPEEEVVASDQAGGAAPAMAGEESASEPVDESDDAPELESVDPASSTSLMMLEPATPDSTSTVTVVESPSSPSPASTAPPAASPTAETALTAPVEVVQGQDASQPATRSEPESPWWRVAQIMLGVGLALCVTALLLSRPTRARVR